MKVCLYGELTSILKGSGIGSAIDHQQKALELNGVEVTTKYKDQYDLIDINTIGPRSAYVAHKMRWRGKPTVIHTHTTVEDAKDSFKFSTNLAPKLKGYLKYFYQQSDLLISPTEYTKGILREYGIQKNIEVVSNGVDIKNFTKKSEHSQRYRKTHGIDGIAPYCVAAVFKRKGIVDFMEVAKSSMNKFMWVGRYHKDLVDKETKKAVEQKPDNVILTGFAKDVVTAHQSGDIFFFPSYCENQGISILEAAACKKPLVLRDLPVYQDWLIDGQNCLFAKNNEEFSRHIESLANDGKKRREMGKKAYEMAKDHDLKKIGKKLISVYETVL